MGGLPNNVIDVNHISLTFSLTVKVINKDILTAVII